MTTIRQPGTVMLVTVSPSHYVDYKDETGRRRIKYFYINQYDDKTEAKRLADQFLLEVRNKLKNDKIGHISIRPGFQYYNAVITKDRKKYEKKYPIKNNNNDEQQSNAKKWLEEKCNELGVKGIEVDDENIPNTPEDPQMNYGGSVFVSNYSKKYRVMWRNENNEHIEKLFSGSKFDDAEKSANEFLESMRLQYGNGSICEKEAEEIVNVVMQKNPIRKEKKFVVSESLSKDEALKLAENYRRYWSNQMGLTYSKTPPPIITAHIDENLKKHIAGFFDGDGGVSFNKLPSLSFYQSQQIGIPTILHHIQKLYGGNINVEKKTSINRRDKHILKISDDALLWNVVRDLIPFCVVKKRQLNLVLEYITKRRQGDIIDSKYYCTQIKFLNKKSEYQKVMVHKDELSDAYIAGLLDAEGCVCLDKKLSFHIGIAQLVCPSLLKAIQGYFDTGMLTKKEIIFNSTKGLEMTKRIFPYSIQKKAQLELAIPLMENIRDRVPVKKRKMLFEDTYGELKKYKKI